MATPTFTHDYVTLADAESTTNWFVVGNPMLVTDNDVVKQGSNSLQMPPKSTGLQGATFDNVTPINFTVAGRMLLLWLKAAGAGFFDTTANGGARIRCGSGVTNSSDYNEYTVGGSDADWVIGGAWRLVVLDLNRTPDYTNGSPNIAAIRHVGFVGNFVGTSNKTPALWMDAIRYGSKMEITGGSDGDPLTLQSIVDSDTNAFGALVSNRTAGTFEINGPSLIIGDEVGSATTVVSSVSERVIFADQPVRSTTRITLKTAKDTAATTKLLLGNSVGTGENIIGFQGTVFNRINIRHGLEPDLDLSANITSLKVYGSIFRNMRGLIKFGSGDLVSSSFSNCGSVDIGSAFARELVFAGYTPTTGGALKWGASTNIKRSKFFANVDATNLPAAIEHPNVGTFTYDGLQFSGNSRDINYTAAASSGALTINNSGGSNAATSKILNPTGNSVVINTSVDLTFNDIINGSRLFIRATSGGPLSVGTVIYNNIVTTNPFVLPFNFTGNQPVLYRVANASGSPKYKRLEGNAVIQSTGLTLYISQELDE